MSIDCDMLNLQYWKLFKFKFSNLTRIDLPKMTHLPDSWQVLKYHPTPGCGNGISLPLLIATSQLVADARKEDSLPVYGKN